MSEPTINRRDLLLATGLSTASLALASVAGATNRENQKGKSVAGLRHAPLKTVRVGFIGVGARGSGHVYSHLRLEGVEIKAICDPHLPSANAAVKQCTDLGRPAPTLYTNGDKDYLNMVKRDDIDIVVIATPWVTHAPMSIAAMRAGKHAFVEVPMATTVDDLWDMVDTAEQTQRHCMMMENVCYGREELLVLNMVRQGVLGELLHGEGAYIHDLRGQMNEVGHGTGSWRTLEYTKRNGNLYPTHGLGPVAQYMNINRGDRFDFMSSVSSNSRVRDTYAKEHYPVGHPHHGLKFVCGDINTSIIRTVNGKTIMVQWDEQLPRPYNRLNLIQGTKGVWGGFPDRLALDGSADDWTEGDGLKKVYDQYEHPLFKRMGEESKRNGGHGGMDFLMWWRTIYCLRNGEPLDQDVYEGASWSVVGPLSEKSVKNRGRSVDFPDFTRGNWKTTAPLGIVS